MKFREIIRDVLPTRQMKFFSIGLDTAKTFKGLSGSAGKTLIVALSALAFSSTAMEMCEAPAPLASWNFNLGEHPDDSSSVVDWHGDQGGLVPIANTDLQGLEFLYRGKGPEGDSSSELRYSIKQPQSHTWEYLKIYQPVNFYHRAVQRIESPEMLEYANWKEGDTIENEWGVSGKVAGIKDKWLYITDYEERFTKNWGAGKTIFNRTSGGQFTSVGSRDLVTNNKFSTQWQGKYSNAGMTMETEAVTPRAGGRLGVSYCRPTINTSQAHKSTGTVSNTRFNKKPAVCFDPVDNGRVVEFVVERKRSSAYTARDGSYRIWKKVEGSDWNLIFSNTRLRAYQKENNHFDHGYVFGWSNSGYKEDTKFYLLGWQLWNEKPTFLPNPS